MTIMVRPVTRTPSGRNRRAACREISRSAGRPSFLTKAPDECEVVLLAEAGGAHLLFAGVSEPV